MSKLIIPRDAMNPMAFSHIERINCDHAPSLTEIGPCKAPADHAPRLLVPSKTQMASGHTHLRIDFRDFHFCSFHIGELKVERLLTDRFKAQIEDHAKKMRPHDFVCDFEAAHLVYVSVFTPEYKYFELVKHLMPREEAEQSWGGMIARSGNA